jgi:hypothetical protein
VPKYKVTGGSDGKSGVHVDNRRHEPGDTFESTVKKVGWLIDAGYIVPTGKHPSIPESED